MPHEEVDLALVDRARRGDRDAFNALVVHHQSSVRRLTRALCSDDDRGDDAAQEAFVSAWRHLSTWDGAGTFGAWLMTIARHAALRTHRRRSGEPAHFDAIDDLGALGQAAGWGTESPETSASIHEQLEALRAALGRLSDDDRQIIVLRDIDGLSGDEAASVLELPLPTMKTRLHRARLRLMAAMADGGGDHA